MSMNDDFCRRSFVTTIHCAKCGEQLTGAYSPEARPQGSDETPTGAAMVHNRISVWPCKKCGSAADEFCKAFKVLQNSIAEKP